MKPHEFKFVMEELNALVARYQTKNNKISECSNKNTDSGRLAKLMRKQMKKIVESEQQIISSMNHPSCY